MQRKKEVKFFGKRYASEEEFLKAHGIEHFDCWQRFRLTPSVNQEQKRAFYGIKYDDRKTLEKE